MGPTFVFHLDENSGSHLDPFTDHFTETGSATWTLFSWSRTNRSVSRLRFRSIRPTRLSGYVGLFMGAKCMATACGFAGFRPRLSLCRLQLIRLSAHGPTYATIVSKNGCRPISGDRRPSRRRLCLGDYPHLLREYLGNSSATCIVPAAFLHANPTATAPYVVGEWPERDFASAPALRYLAVCTPWIPAFMDGSHCEVRRHEDHGWRFVKW